MDLDIQTTVVSLFVRKVVGDHTLNSSKHILLSKDHPPRLGGTSHVLVVLKKNIRSAAYEK